MRSARYPFRNIEGSLSMYSRCELGEIQSCLDISESSSGSSISGPEEMRHKIADRQLPWMDPARPLTQYLPQSGCAGSLLRPDSVTTCQTAEFRNSRRNTAMAKRRSQGVSRREFVKIAGAGTLAAGMGPAFLFQKGPQKTLKIIQWSHFVPAYDKEWFDTVFTKQWGEKHNTNVIVDHISLTEIPARAAAEVSAQQGHDLCMFLSPPAAYENQVIDHREIYEEVQRKHGKPIDLAVKSSLNPRTKKYFAFADSYVPDPGNWRKDLWSEVGYPNGPDNYDQLLDGARKIRQKQGNPCGIGLSQELDTNMAMRALMWSFGASEQDENGNVVDRK